MPATAALETIDENFKFLVLEVIQQIQDTRRVLIDGEAKHTDAVFSRDDYVDNLKSVIENKCYSVLGSEDLQKTLINRIRGLNIATSNLERIADFAVNIVGQLKYLQRPETLAAFDPAPFFDLVEQALRRAIPAIVDVNMQEALELCRTEIKIDECYAQVFDRIMSALRDGEAPEDLVTSLFIFRYFERMGDALLNIGEAAIFAGAGEKIKISQFQALANSLEDVDIDIMDVDYEGIWETRSGGRIGRVHARTDDPETARWTIFKEGRADKVLEEKQRLERWEALVPGLPPRVFSYQEHGSNASLLMEYLEGETLQQVILGGDHSRLTDALALMLHTVDTIWTGTLEPTPCHPKFIRQLEKRLAKVVKVHPEFARPTTAIGDARYPSLLEAIEHCRVLDDDLIAPCRVLIHGDFNTDNIIINPEERQVHYIDLHRSKTFDYVQDISVFVVSNFRMPVSDGIIRSRLDAASMRFFEFGREFAARHGDATFAARAAAGIARSMLTSTRFELSPDFARTMLLRGRYLLMKLQQYHAEGRPWEEFQLPTALLHH
ncbi:MAG: PhoU domain-containing protein [Nannocystaceae bacterium]